LYFGVISCIPLKKNPWFLLFSICLILYFASRLSLQAVEVTCLFLSSGILEIFIFFLPILFCQVISSELENCQSEVFFHLLQEIEKHQTWKVKNKISYQINFLYFRIFFCKLLTAKTRLENVFIFLNQLCKALFL